MKTVPETIGFLITTLSGAMSKLYTPMMDGKNHSEAMRELKTCQRELIRLQSELLAKKPQWKVEHKFASGWADAEWRVNSDDENSSSMLFDTEAEANAEIDEFIADTKEAYRRGDMDSEYNREDYRAVMVEVEGEPLPLWPGAKPCLQCGHCCKVRSCGFGDWDEAKHQCVELVDNGDGTFRCAIYDKIIKGDDKSWKMAPAFGAGCCSGWNSDRLELEKRRREQV